MEPVRQRLTYYVLAAVFTLWVLYDAYRRRAPFHWFLVVLLLPPPLGGLLYFLVFNWRKLATLIGFSELAELEQGAATSPTPDNQLALADALEARGNAARAEPLYRSVTAKDPDNLHALQGLARALLSLERPQEASDLLAQVLAKDSAYGDYSAALDYAEALARAADVKGAVSLLDGLVTVEPRINHRIALAHYLMLDGQFSSARAQLKHALEDFSESSHAEQKRQERWAKRAQKMLAELALNASIK